MSHQEQQSSKTTTAAGPSAGPQGSGFGGERRDSAEADERDLSRQVSRETTSDSSPTPEERMLDEIMERSMNTGPAPAAEEPPQDAEEEKKPSPPAAKPNRRSAVYLYLLVLFGAAFLMLLLAYFIQQRSSENAISDLRDTMNLSRAELMEQIDTLKEDKAKLTDTLTEQSEQLTQRQMEYEVMEQNWHAVMEQYGELANRSAHQNVLIYLEQFNRAGDWLMSGTLVERLDPHFNRRSKSYSESYAQYVLPTQEKWYLELREELFEQGGCMVVEGYSTTEDDSDYTETPRFGDGIFEEADRKAAGSLATALMYYPIDLEISASFVAEYFQPGSEALERLSAGAFQPSTVELFEQARADLMSTGYLVENPDGTLIALDRNGEPVPAALDASPLPS